MSTKHEGLNDFFKDKKHVYKRGTLQGKKEIFTKQHELSTDCDEVAKCYKDYARCYKNLRQARLQD